MLRASRQTQRFAALTERSGLFLEGSRGCAADPTVCQGLCLFCPAVGTSAGHINSGSYTGLVAAGQRLLKTFDFLPLPPNLRNVTLDTFFQTT